MAKEFEIKWNQAALKQLAKDTAKQYEGIRITWDRSKPFEDQIREVEKQLKKLGLKPNRKGVIDFINENSEN